MLTDYTLPLADARADLATVGGKGASLARLAAARLPVPGGFQVTTAAYQQLVADTGLRAGILAVVVRRLVCAEAAGVLFTANPVTGQRAELVITAAWGLGEATDQV